MPPRTSNDPHHLGLNAFPANLPAAERIRLIGDLIAIAAIRHSRLQHTTQPMAAESRPAGTVNPSGLVKDKTEKRLVHYLSITGSAAPHELSAGLGLSRATVTRKLARLRMSGVVKVSGSTKGATYRLRTDFSGN